MASAIQVRIGVPYPLGAIPSGKGINFALHAPKAEEVRLVLYQCGQDAVLGSFNLDPVKNKSFDIWCIAFEGLPESFDYCWFLKGNSTDPRDIPYDPERPVLDPFARHLNTPEVWGKHDQLIMTDKPTIKARCCMPETFDWQHVAKPAIPLENLVIYEMHVRGFTIDPSSRSQHPGSYLGLIEKIPYLKELGINAVELLPIYEFDERAWDKIDPVTKQRLCNYWGYSTINFFCPMKRFASAQDIRAPIREFKTMVRELHRAGIEVILDVVYNHTAEGHPYPIFSFKGIDNPGFYIVDEQGKDTNFSGTGNTFAGNTPLGQELIIQSLRYWATEMQVDGFRFDLASILTRGEKGAVQRHPSLMRAIAHDPVLRGVKLIAEGWDAAGLYQLGQFPAWGPWSEWNGKYRDSVRRFIKGTDNNAGFFATALCGSQELYGHYQNGPSHSVNFITCHDGYTLRDLVSYQGKHNLRNAENNQDGNNQNDSWNCGAEGPTDSAEINKLRERQMRNFHLALMISQGIPMVLMGDEYGHTKSGNNNTWCQDNDLNWFKWDEIEKSKDFHRFFRLMIAFRKRHSLLMRRKFLTKHDIAWNGPLQDAPDWHPPSRFVSAHLHNEHKHHLYFAFNASASPVTIQLPLLKPHFPHLMTHSQWHLVADTSLPPPSDILDPPIPHTDPKYNLPAYSSVLFESK